MSAATIVLHAGFIVAGMVTTLLGPILPALTTRWGMSDVVAGGLFTAQFLGSMSATLVAPAIAARIGARGALALGFSFLAAGTFTIGVAPHAIGVAATVTYGLGLGLVLPLTNIAIAATHPDRAASALSLVNVSWGIGAVIWPIAVRTLGTADSVAAPLAVLAVACVIMGFVCRLGIPAILLTVKSGGQGPSLSTPVATPGNSALVWRAALFGTLIFLYVGTENAVAGWVAEFARRIVSGASTTWALAPTAFWAAITTGRLLASVALRRVSESALIRTGLALATAGVLAITFAASTPKGVIAGAAAAGLGLAAIFPLLWALVTRSISAAAPAAAGPLYASGGFGGAILPWAVGAVSSAVGDLRAGLAVPLSALLVLLICSWMKVLRHA
jgi:FHS family glucose/mannose:H+ symporter-like MFS transporter